ncbi:MAG: anion permease, partial [Burkholderiales bacterium]|nr:anion permease [Burkholderiales bacterium]
MSLSKDKIIKIIVLLVAVTIGIVIANLTPPEPLTTKSMLGLGIFVCFVILSMVEIMPDYVCWLAMCTAWAATKCVTVAQAFGAFTTTTWWLVVGAMVLAAAVAKCGLLKRIALFMMTRFPVTYKWQTLSLLLTGFIVSPMIPSGAVKVTLMSPLALSISDAMGFKRRSKGASGLFASMFLSIGLMIPTMISATFINYVIIGALGDQYPVSYMMWFVASIPWIVLTLGLGYFVIHFLYHVDSTTITATNEALVAQRKALGPITKNEIITAVVLSLCLILWITERMHGLNAAFVTLAAVIVLSITQIVDRLTFR